MDSGLSLFHGSVLSEFGLVLMAEQALEGARCPAAVVPCLAGDGETLSPLLLFASAAEPS